MNIIGEGSFFGTLGTILDPFGLFSGGNSNETQGPSTPDPNAGLTAMANASRDTAIAQSNAQVQMAQMQAATMQLGILQSSQQAQFQTLAWLTDRLDSNDTKLQIAVENAKLQFQAQSDRHVEHMEQLKLDARELDIREAETAQATSSFSTSDFFTA